MPKVDAEVTQSYGIFVTGLENYISQRIDHTYFAPIMDAWNAYDGPMSFEAFCVTYISDDHFKHVWVNWPNWQESTVAKRTTDDIHWESYITKIKKYKTETSCPICNTLIKFKKVRKIPFKDKCEGCEYDFTFIYKKRIERFPTYTYDIGSKPKQTLRYIEYDGIKASRPRAPSKNRDTSKSKREAISREVQDRVWNRDGGKCAECGSNENLEFDHIIPHSKGGANTYRNIQLLCEQCNREKSDNIG